MVPKKVTSYLEKQKIPYVVVEHKKVFTAYDLAQTLKVRFNEIVKTLLVKSDKEYYLVSLPADKNIDFKLLAKAVKQHGGTVKKLEIPKEKMMAKVLKIKPGAISAFAALHKVKAIVDKDLSKVKDIIVASGSLTHSLRMKAKDYVVLGGAVVANIGKKRKMPKVSAPATKKQRR